MASNSGRNVNLTDGGKLIFHESQATGNFTATIITDDLSAHRIIRIADSDGVIQGLEPGTGWPTSKGGTGLTVVPLNNLLAGTGDEAMKLIGAPTEHNTTLTWDGVLEEFRWVPFDYSGLEVTTATNILNDPAYPGIYSHKTGSQLAFKNLEPLMGIKLTALPSKVQIEVDLDTLEVTGDNIVGTIPPSAGGTGLSVIPDNSILVGGPGNTVVALAPSAPDQYFYYNEAGDVVWGNISYVESNTFQIDYPQARTYYLELRSPYVMNLQAVTHLYESEVAGTSSISWMLTNGLTTTSTIASSNSLTTTGVSLGVAVDGRLSVTLSNIVNVRTIAISIKYRRV